MLKNAFKSLKRYIKIFAKVIAKRSQVLNSLMRDIEAKRRFKVFEKLKSQIPVDAHTIIFMSFMGRSYSDSPKAIFVELMRDERFKDWEFVWAFKESKIEDLQKSKDMRRAKIVSYGSREFYETLARAKYWISNSRLPNGIYPTKEDGYRSKSGLRASAQIYIQTWHGTPLKKLGADISGENLNAMHSNSTLAKLYKTEAQKWTYLLSPSSFATEKFISAFSLEEIGKQNTVVELGYPRNDYLINYSAEDIERIKGELGVPNDKKILLYAPTWRDNQHHARFGYTLNLGVDFKGLQESLNDEYVILFRAHPFVANKFDFDGYGDFLFDVSKYDDINELYIISDMLITDYSSVFFDYAILQRPIIFYMYDKEQYADEIRGFYLALTDLPGEIVQTQDSLISAIRKTSLSEQSHENITSRYSVFNKRFNSYEDGGSTKRIISKVFS